MHETRRRFGDGRVAVYTAGDVPSQFSGPAVLQETSLLGSLSALPPGWMSKLSFILITLIGRKTLKNISFLRLLGISISSSLLFFIISNFGVWISSSFYSKDIFGLVACYVAAIPFYYGTLSGTIFYSFFLFASFEFLSRKLSKVTSN